MLDHDFLGTMLMRFVDCTIKCQLSHRDCVIFGTGLLLNECKNLIPVGGFDVQIDTCGTTDITHSRSNQSH